MIRTRTLYTMLLYIMIAFLIAGIGGFLFPRALPYFPEGIAALIYVCGYPLSVGLSTIGDILVVQRLFHHERRYGWLWCVGGGVVFLAYRLLMIAPSIHWGSVNQPPTPLQIFGGMWIISIIWFLAVVGGGLLFAVGTYLIQRGQMNTVHTT